MNKKIIFSVLALVLSMSVCAGCSSTMDDGENVNAVESVVEASATTPEETEAPHEHVFTETITKEATCLEAGEKTLACECGESSVEEVPATGHDFSNYVSNEDATYEADGTETAKCSNCDETDTRTAEGSMLTYSFEDMDATKYAKSTVNVRSLPNSDGENLGSLSTNDEVKVTGKCVETGWFRIEYADGIAYVSDDYLVDEKVVVQASAPAQSAPAQNVSSEFPYELWTLYYTPDGKLSYFYYTKEGIAATGQTYLHNAYPNIYYACNNYNNLQFGHMTVGADTYQSDYQNITCSICDDMDAYIATAEANGLNARSYVETPWRTAEGHKIYKHCG